VLPNSGAFLEFFGKGRDTSPGSLSPTTAPPLFTRKLTAVADAARAFRPELKVLFVTGYAENASVGNGHLDAGMQVIAKPFAMTDFGNKVHEIIERQVDGAF
jgi:hypothetical protein